MVNYESRRLKKARPFQDRPRAMLQDSATISRADLRTVNAVKRRQIGADDINFYPVAHRRHSQVNTTIQERSGYA